MKEPSECIALKQSPHSLKGTHMPSKVIPLVVKDSMKAVSNQSVEPAFGKLGAWLSLACAVHCVIEPIALPLLPLAGIILPVSETMEMLLIGASILLALWNFLRGFLAHGNVRLFVILTVALVFIGGGLLAGSQEDLPHAYEVSLIAVGTLILAIGQFWNRHLHKNCRECGHGHSH
jgi:hypothetical protein